MGQRNQEPTPSEPLEDLFEPVFGDLSDEEIEEFTPFSSEKQRLAEKRRRAERRLELRRLRDELGDYDFDLDDF